MYSIGVDIGGTQTRVALVDSMGRVIKRDAFVTYEHDPIKNLNEIKDMIESFDVEVAGVGVSCPGPLDLKKGIVLTPPNLPGWHNFHLKEESERIMKLPVFVENDANLAGFAEALKGAGKDLEVVQYLTISTGIGGGLVMNGQIYQGVNGFAQELANSILWKDGPQQSFLKKGSLESICSGTAVTKRAVELGFEVEHAGQVNDLAVAGNNEAIQIMDDAKEYLANMIGIIIAILDPSIVVLGGGLALKIDGFVEDVEKRVIDKVFDVQKENVKIVKAELGDDNGLIGGALLAFQKAAEVDNGNN